MRSTSFEMVKLQNKTRDILVLQIQYVYIYSKKCIVCVLEIVLVIHNETIGLWLPNVLTKQSFFSNTFYETPCLLCYTIQNKRIASNNVDILRHSINQ